MEIVSNHIYKEHCKNNFTTQIENIVPNLLKDIFKEDFQKNRQDQTIHKSIINDLNKLVSLRRKILFTLRHLSLESDPIVNEIGGIIRIRNNTAAHGSDNENDFSHDLIFPFAHSVRKIIIKYIFNNDFRGLDCEID
ncbi:hypothetical protein J45TS6_29130 [Paenibacillus sp. J45TS6]|uniref:hypothetical protein n=1 Tax=Paenibacillus sp. J45TS6 TaxID=2807196 RepID=UPI001B07ED21|nr:hypothetical protein [Paenibacillus sp. J45TS6]GIP44454.1 hypothetical protein J45TS6_29130 [Paenibacillus sp. J45TS6]